MAKTDEEGMGGCVKKTPAAPSRDDLEAALEHFNGCDYTSRQYKVSDFKLKYLGDLSVMQLGKYDDFSSWLDFEPGEYTDLDNQMVELRGFRGDEWAKRAAGWLVTGIPPIVVVSTPEADVIGDGRGRVNFAALFDKTVPTFIMTLKKS